MSRLTRLSTADFEGLVAEGSIREGSHLAVGWGDHRAHAGEPVPRERRFLAEP